jgi:putative phage-type endonuclease
MTNIPVDERRHWVGSSESAGILGVSPFVTYFELYHYKSGTIATPTLDGMERVDAGRFLEPAIAEWAKEKWSWPLRKVDSYLRHPAVGRMGASLDFETETGDPVEIKNVDRSIFAEQWAADGATITDAPLHYLVQVQHQLACRPDARRGWIIACVGGNSLRMMEVPRHPRIITKIEREVDRFWTAVTLRQEPKPQFERDAAAIAALYAESDGTMADLRDNNRLPEICAAYLDARNRLNSDKAEADSLRAEILTIVGSAATAITQGFKISAGTVKEVVVPEHTRRPYRNLRIGERT